MLHYFKVYISIILSIIILVYAFSEESKKADTTLTKNDTGKTIIRRVSQDRSFGTTFLIISSKGTVIVIDPCTMPVGIKVDIITSTHRDSDHYDNIFISKAREEDNTRMLLCKAGDFTYKGVHVYGILSSHTPYLIDRDHPTNVLVVIEVDGLRIINMGDIGQDNLTEDQIKSLGKIDIAFMQFMNPNLDMNLVNGKGFKLIEQLKPQTIIPFHSSQVTTKKIGDIVGILEIKKDILTVSREDLKDGKRKVIDLK